MSATSRPVRLIPQTAQPIEFSCPLCGTIHAAYYFGSTRFKVYRCGGCGLTFANRTDPGAAAEDNSVANKPKRTEEQHKALKDTAERLGVSTGEVMRRAIDRMFNLGEEKKA